MNVRGVELVLHPAGDYVSDAIRRTRDFYEADILDDLAERIDGGLLVDAGAQLGNHAAYLAQFVPHTALHAFEPLPANLALLRANLAGFPLVTIHPQALSDHAGPLRMIPDANLGHSRVDRDGTVEVEARTLDSFGFTDVALLKVDVEGHEPALLAGAADTIARCRPWILIEDWTGRYGELLPGYQLARDWGRRHQTYLYAWSA